MGSRFSRRAAEPRRSPVEVYLCDDVPELRVLVRKALEHGGEVTVVGEAGEAVTAIAEIRRLQPDVVLLDLSMPGMDGLESLPRIKEAAPDVSVIVFSGFTAERLAGISLASGADLYVEKGEALEDLRRLVLETAAEAVGST